MKAKVTAGASYEMTNWLWQEGAENIWLSTDPGTRAEGFYRKAGWLVTGTMPNGELKIEKRING